MTRAAAGTWNSESHLMHAAQSQRYYSRVLLADYPGLQGTVDGLLRNVQDAHNRMLTASSGTHLMSSG